MSDPQIFMAQDKTALRFFYAPVRNNFLSDREGREIYDNVLYVEVMTPGSKESAPTLEIERQYNELTGIPAPQVNQQVYERYKAQIDAFKSQSGEGAIQGTPITQWAAIDPGTAATLRAANVHTVEQLAQIPDSSLGVVGIGGFQLREKAQAYVNTINFGGDKELVSKVQELTTELAAAKEKIAALEGRTADAVPVVAVQPAVVPAPESGATTAPPVVAPLSLDTGIGTVAATAEQPASGLVI